MSRIRTIKPEFFRSRSLARCSREARTTFQGLWCEADDHGRGIADARLLKGSIWPLDDDISVADVDAHMMELAQTEHVVLYEVGGEAFYEIQKWEKHQAAAYRRGEAVHPAPAEGTVQQVAHDQTCKEVRDARPVVLEGKGMEGKGRECDADEAVASPPPPRRRDPVLDEAEGILKHWTEHTTPKPVQSHWPEAVRTVAKFLRAGNDAKTIRKALDDVPGVVSSGTLSIALDKLTKPRGRDPNANQHNIARIIGEMTDPAVGAIGRGAS